MASDPKAPTTFSGKREAAQQDGFLREVDEALREEQIVSGLRRYGIPLAAVTLFGLAALGGYLWWNSSSEAAAALQSEQLTVAMDRLEAGQNDAATRDLAPLAKDGPAASRAAAAMTLAAIALQQGKTDDAARRFAVIATDPAMPEPYRDLATIREVAIRFDGLKPAVAIAKLKPLAVPGKAYFGSAGELLAMAYLADGKPDAAGALLAQIGKDKTVPETLRTRVRQLASGLGYDGGIDLGPEATPAAAPAPQP